MILVTVGTQLGFDRLLKALDEWLSANPNEVVAQIGSGEYHPVNMVYHEFLDVESLNELFDNASLIISHAGMGSIITALERGKPIIIVPRRADLGEHRNDHQLATAEKFNSHPLVMPVFSELDLGKAINECVSVSENGTISPFAPSEMTEALKKIINK